MFYTSDSYEATIGLNDKVNVRLPHDNVEDYSVLNGAVKVYTWPTDKLHNHFQNKNN